MPGHWYPCTVSTAVKDDASHSEFCRKKYFYLPPFRSNRSAGYAYVDLQCTSPCVRHLVSDSALFFDSFSPARFHKSNSRLPVRRCSNSVPDRKILACHLTTRCTSSTSRWTVSLYLNRTQATDTCQSRCNWYLIMNRHLYVHKYSRKVTFSLPDVIPQEERLIQVHKIHYPYWNFTPVYLPFSCNGAIVWHRKTLIAIAYVTWTSSKKKKPEKNYFFCLPETGLEDILQAHIHRGNASTAIGPVVIEFTKAFDPAIFSHGSVVGSVETTSSIAKAILASPGEHYINIHTLGNQAGKKRQIIIGRISIWFSSQFLFWIISFHLTHGDHCRVWIPDKDLQMRSKINLSS